MLQNSTLRRAAEKLRQVRDRMSEQSHTTDFENESPERLETMLAAGAEILECYRVLEKTGANIVGEVLKNAGTFYEWDHYPDGDVYDDDTHAQYYYHAHRQETGEHGHFHTFLRLKGIPDSVTPIENTSDTDWPVGDDIICHLIAISMDKQGYPTHLFTTNRWVTGENWYAADDVIRMLDLFEIDHAYPSWPTNRWITAMVRLFYPQIVELVRKRDEKVGSWRPADAGVHAFEDRDLEVTSILPINVAHQIKQVKKALNQT
jgi:hypothetical protein